jgi:hypothetical protein
MGSTVLIYNRDTFLWAQVMELTVLMLLSRR